MGIINMRPHYRAFYKCCALHTLLPCILKFVCAGVTIGVTDQD